MVARVACVLGLMFLVGCECGVKPGDDAGVMDSGAPDAGRPDAGALDAGPADGGLVDAGEPDAGEPDAGEPDAGQPDAGEPDAGPVDAGEPDAGLPDAGPLDAGTCADFGCTSGVCCAAACFDTMSSNEHCGGCNQPCMANAPGTTAQCTSGMCQRACETGLFDCDGDATNGCEATSTCLCMPGSTRSCYSGAAGTAGVGVCRTGTETCAATGLSYGACVGEVIPAPAEICGDFLDNDCNGARDDSVDADGDGYSVCGGDCCDDVSCPNNVQINPGAFDFVGNALDDDCDGTVDGAPLPCDATLASDSVNPNDAARAMGLCSFRTGNGIGPWGVISAAYQRSNSTGSPAATAHALRTSFGTSNLPLEGSQLLVLSTGHAAIASDPNGDPAQSTNHGITSTVPADWLAANGGLVPGGGCPRPAGGSVTYDPVMLRLTIRVPSNAKSFSLRANYLSSDYAEYVCTQYVDQLVVLLDSTYTPQGGSAPNPFDKNLAVESGNLTTPLRTHFTQCVNGVVGCGNGGNSTYGACTSTAGLASTGYDTAQAGQCDANSLRGGGTGWMTIAGNVVPGETITLRIAVWDSADGTTDSNVLIDHFQWSQTYLQPGG